MSPSSRSYSTDHTQSSTPRSGSGGRCQIQNHTAYGAYLLNRFPDISSTSTSSSVSVKFCIVIKLSVLRVFFNYKEMTSVFLLFYCKIFQFFKLDRYYSPYAQRLQKYTIITLKYSRSSETT